jgi:glyoxylase-like metal-dependent hydrolase (beta-lactamase superfamily II)
MPHSAFRIATLMAMFAVTLSACSKKEEPPPAAAAPATEASPAAQSATVAVTQANVFRFKIGDLSAMALRDGEIAPLNDNKVFGVGLTPADVAAVLGANNLATDKLPLSVQPLLVRTPDRVLLFDTGAGTLFGPTVGHVQEAFKEAGVDPGGVTDIFISHSHGDHVGGLVNAEGRLAFPNATIHISRPEWEHLSSQEQYKPLAEAMKPKLDAFAPGAELIPETVKAVEIKGHTPGHSGFQVTSRGESILYVGDSMHHYVISVQKPEWTIAFDGDNKVATASRVALVSELAASGARVYSVHFPFPGIGKMEKQGDNAMWVAE